MKKQFIAAAVAAALAAPAMAQNVTITGTIDTAYGSSDKGGTAADAQGYTGAVSNTFATSGVSISGTEDLGGGLKAGFLLTRQFTAHNGADAEAGWDDMAVSISGSFGSITAGVQSLAGREAGGFGKFGNFARSTGFSSLGDERDSTINYVSPKINGVTISAGASLNAASGDVASTAYGKSQGFGATYENGPVRIGVGYQTGKYGSKDAKDTSVAADYNFGFATIGVVSLGSDTDTATAGVNKMTSLAVSVPLPGGVTVMGGVLRMKESAQASGGKANGYQLAISKALSKRTSVYIATADLENEANANFKMRGLNTSSTVADGDDPKATVVGIVHKF